MTFDPMTNLIQWGLLTDDEKAALKNCGGPWVVYNSLEGWHPCSPYWDFYAIYRQATPDIIPASVDWSCFGPDIVAVAADEDGRVFAYLAVPSSGPAVWKAACGMYHAVTIAFPPHAYVRGTDIWQNSLVVRP
jgi:hypothetical protein